MHRIRRGVLVCGALAALLALTATSLPVGMDVAGAAVASGGSGGAGGAGSGGRQAPALWRVGTCYETADPAAATVDLKSTVACDEDHAVQIVAGAPLPKQLAKVDHATLLDPNAKQHAELVAFAERHCRPRTTVTHVYPKAAERLRELFTQYGVRAWMPPAVGRLGWLVPDADSFALGATDVLCVHVTDPQLTGTTAGDIRRISTRAPLATMRLCADLGVDGTRATFVRCDRPHDIETLLRITVDVSDNPDDVLQWTDGDWGHIDEACQDFATAVIGRKRNSLLINADTDPTQPAIDGTRVIDCRAVPFDESKAFAAGAVATGAANRTIRLTRS